MKKRRRVNRTLTTMLAAILALALFWPTSVLAASQMMHDTVGFYVRADIPENQIDTDMTYFDLRVSPGMKQTLNIEVFNTTNAPMEALVEAISASTNRNGIIDYRTPGIHDETLFAPFSELAVVRTPHVTVEANASVIVLIDVTMPDAPYEGVLLGGITITKRQGSDQAIDEDAAVENVYSYVVGVKLTESDTAVAPAFEVLGAEVSIVNHQPAIRYGVRNRAPLIIKNLAVQLDIYDKNGETPILRLEKQGVDMAPNSVMPLAAIMGEKPLPAGQYRTQMILTHAGEVWSFEVPLSISEEEVATLEENTVVSNGAASPAQRDESLSLAFAVIIAVLLLIIQALIFLLVHSRKNQAQAVA